MTTSSWKETTLGEFVRLQRGHDLTESERRSGTVPIMGSAGENGFHDTAKAKGPGVVIGRSGVGSMGVVTFCPVDYWPHNTVLYVTDFLGNHERFAYYFLQHLNLRRFDSGSAQASLNRNYIYPVRINIPTPKEQSAIAHVLGTFDDKIEHDRRTNETLEQMARAIFKSWFIDFEPVRAKQQGKKPFSMDDTTAALFPDSFEQSGLGKIPKGWTVEPLDKIADFLNGLALQKYPPTGTGDLPVVKIAQLRANSTAYADRASCAVPTPYVINDGDVIFSWSGSLLVRIWTGGTGALNQHLFKVTSSRFPRWFFYLWCEHHLSWFQSIAADKATTMGHIKRSHLSQALVVVPPDSLLRALTPLLEPLFALKINNEVESRSHVLARDLLLPRLLSGEISVREKTI